MVFGMTENELKIVGCVLDTQEKELNKSKIRRRKTGKGYRAHIQTDEIRIIIGTSLPNQKDDNQVA